MLEYILEWKENTDGTIMFHKKPLFKGKKQILLCKELEGWYANEVR